MPTIIPPNQGVTFDTREGGDTLSLTNNHEHGNASYTISINNGAPNAGVIRPGKSDNHNLQYHRTAYVYNTGALDIEADFA
ncbi:hypothetical protein [Sorangium sp. So ce1097]|uniref:hypothetical protein n=1 Tax=Sorangium sp. So ce1097 TaxID=3133330 RepID=UPI003F61167D